MGAAVLAEPVPALKREPGSKNGVEENRGVTPLSDVAEFGRETEQAGSSLGGRRGIGREELGSAEMSGVVREELVAAVLALLAPILPGEYGPKYVVDERGGVTLSLADCAEFLSDTGKVGSFVESRGGSGRGGSGSVEMIGVVYAGLVVAVVVLPATMLPGEYGLEYVVEKDGAVTLTLPLSDCAAFVRETGRTDSVLGGRGGSGRGRLGSAQMAGVVHARLVAAVLVAPAPIPPRKLGIKLMADEGGGMALPLSDCSEFVWDTDQAGPFIGDRGDLSRGG